MTSLLAANPKIDGVFAINDPTAIGADLAAKQAQRSEFFIVGVDGSPDGEEALKRKNSLFVATSAGPTGDGSEGGGDWLRHPAGQTGADRAGTDPVTMIDKITSALTRLDREAQPAHNRSADCALRC